ncbi:MAG: DedA family protein [Gammaproteobacteria bacterium]|nr:DedA family protein [Gammaproteobacteria bacterium]
MLFSSFFNASGAKVSWASLPLSRKNRYSHISFIDKNQDTFTKSTFMEDFIQTYGPQIIYLIVFLGALVEGESIVLTCSILAYRYDTVSIYIVTLLAFCGSVFADQILYFIGRRYGPRLLKKKAHWRARVERASDLLKHHSTWFILSFRFIYGIRTISPLVIGASGIPVKRFSSLNFIAAVFWAILSCGVGYWLGYAFDDQIDVLFDNLQKYKRYIAIGVITLLVSGIGYWFWREKKR